MFVIKIMNMSLSKSMQHTMKRSNTQSDTSLVHMGAVARYILLQVGRKHFPRYWPFGRWIHRSPVNSPHKGKWRVALMLSLICVWINGWANSRVRGYLRRYRAHYDFTVMLLLFYVHFITWYIFSAIEPYSTCSYCQRYRDAQAIFASASLLWMV